MSSLISRSVSSLNFFRIQPMLASSAVVKFPTNYNYQRSRDVYHFDWTKYPVNRYSFVKSLHISTTFRNAIEPPKIKEEDKVPSPTINGKTKDEDKVLSQTPEQPSVNDINKDKPPEPDQLNLNNAAIPPVKLSLFQRFKQMYKDYWYVLIPVHCFTSVFWAGGFYFAVKR